MIRITRLGAVSAPSPETIRQLRAEFVRSHCVCLPGLVEPGILGDLRALVEADGFDERAHEGIGSNLELCMRTGRAHDLLHILFNGGGLFPAVEAITGCDRIASFSGRVYRVVSGSGHHDAWHDDVHPDRLAAMSVNLGAGAFSGGELEIRDRATRVILHRVGNTGEGDAIVFRLAPGLQHRVAEVRGAAPKTAFAGWFLRRPDFLTLLRGRDRAGGEPLQPGGA